MKLTVMTTDERFVTLDVEPYELVENVKAILEVETQIPLHQQQLLFNGKEIPNAQRLNAAGVGEGELLMVVPVDTATGGGASAGSQRQPAQEPPAGLKFNLDGSAANPVAFMNHVRNDPRAMEGLFSTNPEFAQAIVVSDTEKVQNLLRESHRQKVELQRQKQHELELLRADPFDVEAQRKIEEAIHQRNIDENWETAIEYNPEAFGRVIMLYVDMEVNGVPLKAFVDSGAQSTIISKGCAERCGLLRLLDNRFRGIAQGVGQSEIVGRIHVAPLKIGTEYYPCSFTVLDQPNIEFIFGLDMLRKHQCSIDLRDNVLRVGGGAISVPFLPEKDLPLNLIGDDRGDAESSTPTSLKRYADEKGKTVRVNASTPGHSEVASGATKNEKPVVQQVSDSEAKIRKLMELGFDRPSVERALTLFDGSEDQAASYLFGG